MRPAPPTNRRRITEPRYFATKILALHGLSANQITIATTAAMIAAHSAGVTCFELPLRGESLAA